MKDNTDRIYYPASERFPQRAARWVRLSAKPLMRKINKYTATAKYLLPPPFLHSDKVKIAFISDLHYTGSEKCRKILEEIISVLKEENCGILLLGGDICADSSHLKYLPEVLKQLAACAPKTIAIPGNWERGKTWIPIPQWQEMYKQCGIDFLFNSTVELNGITVTGVDDCGKGYPVLPGEFSSSHCNILLAHRPDTVVWLDRKKNHLNNCHLALCGHTHAGQIRFIRGLLPASKYGWKFDYGWFNHYLHNTKMYVTSGTGELSFPFRLNCRREIVIFCNQAE